jgi:hypothetical protein
VRQFLIVSVLVMCIAVQMAFPRAHPAGFFVSTTGDARIERVAALVRALMPVHAPAELEALAKRLIDQPLGILRRALMRFFISVDPAVVLRQALRPVFGLWLAVAR